ncbi:MAG TPA: hypothetical protein VFL42_06975, partial [Terriglobales bacterium]|nr:hypothetical protein [Terriglobales bacterium]
RVLMYAAAGLGLGAALAAFYLIPVIHEKSWVQIGEVLAPGYRPQDNFLFSRTGDVEHNRFNLLVSAVGTAELIILAIAGWTSRTWRLQARWDWQLLATWAIAITIIMLPLTGILWGILPQLQFVQFPWRWLLCLNVPFAFFVTLAFRSWIKRAVVCATMLCVLWLVWHRVQPPWWDQAADIQELQDFISDGGGYEGTDEYVPAGVDPQAVNKNAPLVTVAGKGKVNVRMLEWSPQFKRFTAEVDRPERLRLKLFNYIAWQVQVNGVSIVAKSHPKTGEILIPLETGISEVRVKLVRTPDRTAGGFVSILTVLLLAVWAAYRHRAPLLGRIPWLAARISK